MINARINGIDCKVFYEERLFPEEAPSGYPYMYHIRHDEDNWTHPISLEKFVAVNFFGTVFIKKPLEIDKDGYLEIEEFKPEWDYVEFRVDRTLFEKMLDLQWRGNNA